MIDLGKLGQKPHSHQFIYCTYFILNVFVVKTGPILTAIFLLLFNEVIVHRGICGICG